MELFYVYLLLINAAGLFLMLADKQKAKRKQWRIPEVTLLCTALSGGSIGVFIGMHIFRHKTKHPVFFLGVPLILCLQVLLIILLL